MPLTTPTFDNNTSNIVDITKTIIDLAQHPKKLPWISAHPEAVFADQFDTLFNRIDRIDHYFDDGIPDIKKERILKKHTFLSVLCFYEWGQEKYGDKYRPILSIYSASVMINNDYVDTVIENLQRIITPGKFLIFTSKNPDFITKSINDGQIFQQDDAGQKAPSASRSFAWHSFFEGFPLLSPFFPPHRPSKPLLHESLFKSLSELVQHRIVESLELEGTFKGHLIQLPCNAPQVA